MQVNKVNPTTIDKNQNRRNVKIASIAGSAVGIAGAVAGIYTMAKKGNPCVTLKNLSYNEKDVLLLGVGSIVGGLTGGLIADKDKNNKVPKLREASQQLVGCTAIPVGLLAVGNKILEKTNFKLPQLKSTSRPAMAINGALAVLPKVAMTIGCLAGGMQIGNKLMNSINNKVFNEDVKHDVKPEDFLVHTDDLCLTANMVLKDIGPVSAITSKILPATFLVSGAKTGMSEA